MKLYEDIYYESMTATELIFTGAERISEFVEELKGVTLGKLDEATARGKERLHKLELICAPLVRINKAMQTHLSNGSTVDVDDVVSIVEGLDETDTPAALSILRMVFRKRDKPIYDDEDKQYVHRACQAYDQLVGEFRHLLLELSKLPNNRSLHSINPPQFDMETKSAFKAIDADVNDYVETNFS